MRILCVRFDPNSKQPEERTALMNAFPGVDIEFVRVDPQTKEELRDMANKDDVAGVWLQPDPIPQLVIAEGRIPVLVTPPNGVQRVRGLKPILETFPPSGNEMPEPAC